MCNGLSARARFLGSRCTWANAPSMPPRVGASFLITSRGSYCIPSSLFWRSGSSEYRALSTIRRSIHDALHVHFHGCRVFAANARRKVPADAHRLLLFVSSIYVGTTTLTKTSLGAYFDIHLNGVVKSGLIPVMAGSIVILGKRYSLREWLSALMLCGGVVIFNLSTKHGELHPDARGCGVLECRVDMRRDARQLSAKGPVKRRDARPIDAGAIAVWHGGMLVITLYEGTFLPGMSLLLHDVEVSAVLVLWAIAITAGTALILQLVAEYSAVVAIVVTTCRKALTLLASFILFPKHLGWGHPIGAALVFGAAFVSFGAKKAGKPKSADDFLAAARANGG